VPQHVGYVERSYALSVPLAPAFDRPPSLSRLAEAVINPRILKRYFNFLSNRELAAAAKRPQFVLALRADLADRVFGKSAPSP
jgi:hypothetical protein